VTHDELLEKVSNYKDAGFGSLVALRAVVELHKPKSSHPDGWHEEIHCAQGDDQFHYPCPTIQAIEKDLI